MKILCEKMFCFVVTYNFYIYNFMYILAFKIVFISLNRQELILHENVKQEKVLFKYYLQLLYLTFLPKIKSCQVIAKNRPFFTFFPFFAVILANIARRKKCSSEKRCILISFSRWTCRY